MKDTNLLKSLLIAVAFLTSTAFSMLMAQQDKANSNDKIENIFDANDLDGSVNMTIGQIMEMSGEETDAYSLARINFHIERLLKITDKNGEIKSEQKQKHDNSYANYINQIFFEDNVLGEPAKVDQFHGAYNTLMIYIGRVANDQPEYTFDQLLKFTIKKHYEYDLEQKK